MTKHSLSEEKLIDRDEKQSAKDNQKSESNLSLNKRALKIKKAISNENSLAEVPTTSQRLKARKTKKNNRIKK